MTKEKFLKIKAYFEGHKNLMKIMIIVAKILTYSVFIGYPILLVYLFIKAGTSAELIKTIVIPGVTFIAFSIIRKLIDRPRPYEVWDEDPIIEKDTRGRSFPSRHLFSMCLIGMVFIQHNIYLGIAFLIGAVYLAIYRVIMGVHFIKDVIAGSVIGLIIGAIMLSL